MNISRIAAAIVALAACGNTAAGEGSIDPSFGNQGFRGIDITTPSTLTIDSRGRLVVSGMISHPATRIARLLPNGQPDTSFGIDGMQYFDLSSSGLYTNQSVVPLPAHVTIPGAGYYVSVAARTIGGWQPQVSAIVRLTPAGAFDTAYGNNGVVAEAPGIRSLTIDPDGKPVAFGSPLTGGAVNLSAPYLIRLTANGTRDPAFNNGAPLLFPDLTTASKVLRASDGSYYVAGTQPIPDVQYQFTIRVAHAFADGTRDLSFGSNGVAVLTFGVGSTIVDQPSALAQQADGKILVAGSSGTSSDSSPRSCVVARLNPDGTLDPGFAAGGKLIYGTASTCGGIAVSTTGRILVSGSKPTQAGFVLALNGTDGSIDSSYGASGVYATPTYYGWINFGLVLDRQQRAVPLNASGFDGSLVYRLTSDLIFTEAFDTP